MNTQEFKEYAKAILKQYRDGLLTQEEVAQKIMAIPRDGLVKEDDKIVYDNTDIGRVFDIAWEFDVPVEHRERTWEQDWSELEKIVYSW